MVNNAHRPALRTRRLRVAHMPRPNDRSCLGLPVDVARDTKLFSADGLPCPPRVAETRDWGKVSSCVGNRGSGILAMISKTPVPCAAAYITHECDKFDLAVSSSHKLS